MEEITTQTVPGSIEDLERKMNFAGKVVKITLAGAIVDIGMETPGVVHISQLQKAFIYMGLGDYDQVFELYKRGYKERDSFFTWFKVAPHFDSIRSDPRFKEYLKLLNLDI